MNKAATHGQLSTYQRAQRFLGDVITKSICDSKKQIRPIIQKVTANLNSIYDEIVFYLTGINLIRKLRDAGAEFCFPRPGNGKGFYADGLYDPLLIEKMAYSSIVANDFSINETGELCILTGANQGGKTTFVKAVGLAQLLFQLGLPITAKSAVIAPCDKILTLF
jgi:DNA mismatch repair ATPase MutS